MCFIDIEMTHEDPRIGSIVEIAAYLVSGDLTEKFLIADFVIKTDLASIQSEYISERFKKSGLWADIQNPEKALDISVAEDLILGELTENGIM
jgi:oligoribonuclease (3'-5' exoribonuclease)